jgi:hypothetical protein
MARRLRHPSPVPARSLGAIGTGTTVQMLDSRRPQASFDNGQFLAFRRLLVNHNGADQRPTNADLYLANEISSEISSQTASRTEYMGRG